MILGLADGRHEVAQPLASCEGEGSRGLGHHAVGRSDAFDGVQQHGPHRAEDDHSDLHGIGDPHEQHHDGDQHRRRDGAEELQQRLERLPQPPVQPDQRSGDDADRDRQDDAQGKSAEARKDIREERGSDPGVDEGLQDDERPREELGRRDRRPHTPEQEQQEGQADGIQDAVAQSLPRLRALLRHPHRARVLGHSTSSPRTDWCQAKDLRSTKRKPRLIANPRRPVTMTSE